VTYEDCQYVLTSLESCLKDYSTDQRGDVGSWVRIATMDFVNYLLPLLAKLDRDGHPYLGTKETVKLVSLILKQSVERIDKVRSNAGQVLCNLVLDSEWLQCPGRDILRGFIKR
jgi:hypothetical protein